MKRSVLIVTISIPFALGLLLGFIFHPAGDVSDKSISFRWEEIGIRPFSTEGSNYTITSFDVADNNLLALIVSNDKNELILVSLKRGELISSIDLDFVPLDILVFKNTIYVLGEKDVVAFSTKGKLIDRFAVNEPKIYCFDKLVEIDDKLSLLMSDGSSYLFTGEKFIKKENLGYRSSEIWIEKTGIKSFSLKSGDLDISEKRAESPAELGSVTIAGGSERIYCCVDKIASKRPLKIIRFISSDASGFSEDLLVLSANVYSYIKNDYKIHGDHIWYIEAQEQGFTLKNSSLK